MLPGSRTFQGDREVNVDRLQSPPELNLGVAHTVPRQLQKIGS